MNPLTLVKRIQNINAKEASLGISDEASWHAKYKDSAYVFAGGIPFDLTEGDLLAIFAQYGEVVDVNLVRNKDTGKSKGFAFIAYEDQRSTILAVDNLNGAQVLGRTIRVDHVDKYKKKEEEDEETQQKKREERGVCYAFQKGECNRGAGCKYSHDEQRAANTGWGHKEDRHSKWGHDKFDGSRRNGGQSGRSGHGPESPPPQAGSSKSYEKQLDREDRDRRERDESNYREELNWRDEKRSKRHESESYNRDGRDKRVREESHDRGSKWHDESKNREERDRRDEKRSRRYKSESYHKDDRDSRSKDDEYHRHRSHR